jgi:hypothetical protein
MADGRWQMADGGWRMADGGWHSLPFANALSAGRVAAGQKEKGRILENRTRPFYFLLFTFHFLLSTIPYASDFSRDPLSP